MAPKKTSIGAMATNAMIRHIAITSNMASWNPSILSPPLDDYCDVTMDGGRVATVIHQRHATVIANLAHAVEYLLAVDTLECAVLIFGKAVIRLKQVIRHTGRFYLGSRTVRFLGRDNLDRSIVVAELDTSGSLCIKPRLRGGRELATSRFCQTSRD
jgi:hypothetical protein